MNFVYKLSLPRSIKHIGGVYDDFTHTANLGIDPGIEGIGGVWRNGDDLVEV